MEELSSWLIHTLEGVGAEEIALRLDHVQRQPLRAETVKVLQAGGEGGNRHAVATASPTTRLHAWLPLHQLVGKVGVQQQIVQRGVLGEGALDLVEDLGADDAAALPDARTLAEVDAPVELLRGLVDDVESLRVGDQLGAEERVLQVGDELLAVHRRPVERGS